jgi:hypothetical protein
MISVFDSNRSELALTFNIWQLRGAATMEVRPGHVCWPSLL